MKYQHLVSLALAVALLAGCGGTESNTGSAVVGQSTGSVQNAESSQNRCSTFPSMCPSWNALARTP